MSLQIVAILIRTFAPPLFTEPGWNLHASDEIGIDDLLETMALHSIRLVCAIPVVEGIEQAVDAFVGLFARWNVGKMVVKLARQNPEKFYERSDHRNTRSSAIGSTGDQHSSFPVSGRHSEGQ